MRPSTLRRLRVEAGEAGEDDLGEDRGGGGGPRRRGNLRAVVDQHHHPPMRVESSRQVPSSSGRGPRFVCGSRDGDGPNKPK